MLWLASIVRRCRCESVVIVCCFTCWIRATEEPAALPTHKAVPRKNRRGGSELTPLLSGVDEEAEATDLLESARPEDLIDEEALEAVTVP